MNGPTRAARLLTVCALLAAGCRSEGAPKDAAEPEEVPGSDSRPGRVELSEKGVAALGIETAPAAARAVHEEIRATAVIKPNENRLAHVSPRIPGKAIEVSAVLGTKVRPGEPLALLDSLELGEKKSAFLQARTSLAVARRNFDRERRLFRQHISSEKEYLEAKGGFERSEAAYRAAREALRLVGIADREIDVITWGGGAHPLSHFPLLAPFAGTVIEQHVTVGELVRPEDRPYTIADLTTLWILLDVYEKDLSRVAAGAAVEVTVDAYPNETFPGRITYLGDVLDEATRTARARVEIDSRSGRLRPGMFATARIRLPSRGGAEALAVPEAAIQRVHEATVAFVERSRGSYEARTLDLGAESEGFVEVKSGLSPGERVVTKGAFALKSELLKDELAGED
jgi:membrane fusion protein, heavy metal efflux system